MAVEILDAHLFEPASLHDASDPSGIVAVVLVDLHLERRLGMTCIDADHRQAQALKLGPQPRRRRSGLKADPYCSRCLRSHERGNRLRIRIDHTLLYDRPRSIYYADRRLLQ
jgi:hypothetical protein